MVVKGLLQRTARRLKQIQEDPWLFLAGGAVVIVFAVLTTLAVAVRASSDDQRKPPPIRIETLEVGGSAASRRANAIIADNEKVHHPDQLFDREQVTPSRDSDQGSR